MLVRSLFWHGAFFSAEGAVQKVQGASRVQVFRAPKARSDVQGASRVQMFRCLVGVKRIVNSVYD